MQRFFLAGVCASLAILGAARPVAAQRTDKRPNIVILLADDLGYADVGFHGAKDIPTPNIDSLAAQGVRFTSGYVSGPYCSPTRAGLLTGRYQTRFGHEFNGPAIYNGKPVGLPLSETTIADRLKAAGYVTGLVGKWHLGSAPEFHPQKRGFDEFFGFLGAAHNYFVRKASSNIAREGASLFGNQRVGLTKEALTAIGQEVTSPIYRGVNPVAESEYLTDAFAREAVSFIDRHKQQPFFLYLAFNAVHTPMHATDDRLKRFASIEDNNRRTYAAMLTALDEAIGRVLEKLRASELEEDTLVFFFSDNGGPVMPGTSINGSRNTPLRGSKRTTLEGGVRVPFVIRWKGKLPAGKVDNRPIIQLDVLPTALAAAGVPVSPDWKLDGVNLLPYLEGKEPGSPHETFYWRFGQQRAIRKGNLKLVQYDANADQSTLSTRAASVAGQPIITEARLYDVAKDPGERENLAASQPEKVKELDAAWQNWNAQLVPPLWLQPKLTLPSGNSPRTSRRSGGVRTIASEQVNLLLGDGYRLDDVLASWADIEE